MDTQKLKSCPFCGGDPVVESYSEDREDAEISIGIVRCENSVTCSAGISETLNADQGVVKKKAIEKWQRREETS